MSTCHITHARHIGLAVRNFDRQLGFYRDVWGLSPETVESDAVFLAAEGSREPYALRLRKADQDRVDLISLAVPERSHVDDYARRVATSGARIVHQPGPIDDLGGGYGFRFFDPEGRVMEIAADYTPRTAREVKEREHIPTGLSHIVLNSVDLRSQTTFMTDVLGFTVTDYLEDGMVFLKSASEFHHTIALNRNPHVSLNHVAYETRGIDEYMRAAGHMLRAGYQMVWGPGRHGPGDNTFAYFADESGFVAEYTTELQRIAAPEAWVPSVYRKIPEESDQWGTACSRQPEPFVGRPDPGLWTPPPF